MPLTRKRKLTPILFLVSSSSFMSYAHDNIHFYRATNRFEEPRFERKLLTSFDVSLGSGSTRQGRNNKQDKVAPFDIFGIHNMHQLGVNVPNKDLSDVRDIALKQLSLIPARQNFANLSIGGKFSITEAYLMYTQNAAKGFFFQGNLPIRRLTIDELRFTDLSPTDSPYPNSNTPLWQTFLKNFDEILKKYDLSRAPFKERGVGDLCLSLGWTHNHENTQAIDFIDTTFKVGLLIPTGKERNEDQVFALPLGYNGHIGIPISADIAFGAFEWLTIGTHIQVLFFADHTRDMRVKTAPNQSGIIKLAKGKMRVDKGNMWNAAAYLKADHFVRGLSLFIGYSFANQNADHLTPIDMATFDSDDINTDEMLNGWKMHTINLFLEYDFTKEDMRYGPRIGVFYNRPIGGKRIFNTDVGGGTFGLEIAWDL